MKYEAVEYINFQNFVEADVVYGTFIPRGVAGLR